MAQKTVNYVNQLRALMKNPKYVKESIQAYIIPSGDAHHSEYLAECDMRRAFISGFTGSAGTAIVTESAALMWTDGRYYLQATEEMGEGWTLMKEGLPVTPSQGKYLSDNFSEGSHVGVDPNVLSYEEWKIIQNDMKGSGVNLVPIATNLVDLIWEGKPASPSNMVVPLAIKYTGKSCKHKVEEVRSKMAEKGSTLLLVTALDEIAWLLNLRGSDIDYNPVFFSYVLVTQTQVHLFIDESKVTLAVRNHFNEEDLPVNIHAYNKIHSFIIEQIPEQTGKVWISSDGSYSLNSMVPEKIRISEITPIALMKAIKNTVETQGMINCHIRDGVALCRYFAWLEKELQKGNAVTEISGADKLEQFRKDLDDFVGLSFPTITSSGPNGAIIHYHCTPKTDRPITTKELYLCDSGAQFNMLQSIYTKATKLPLFPIASLVKDVIENDDCSRGLSYSCRRGKELEET
uniref:Uncharacterized protein n=1 Tax=Timema tahoe TaxID=61484 RepID=A0A7R9P126_9NEOP|nr:unnamed protein product [Timema tahoe]